jgi:hypothetical protein|tara:strand:+ start:488 stop:730 length:243 start_codon:yes stop_codon:yes gene_type:complete
MVLPSTGRPINNTKPIKKMEDYQQRVIDEKNELDEKIAGLSKFLGNVNQVPSDERVRMHTQLGLMEQYSLVLGQRIEAFS